MAVDVAIALTPPMTSALPFDWHRNSDVEFTGARTQAGVPRESGQRGKTG